MTRPPLCATGEKRAVMPAIEDRPIPSPQSFQGCTPREWQALARATAGLVRPIYTANGTISRAPNCFAADPPKSRVSPRLMTWPRRCQRGAFPFIRRLPPNAKPTSYVLGNHLSRPGLPLQTEGSGTFRVPKSEFEGRKSGPAAAGPFVGTRRRNRTTEPVDCR
jgi:hypothetical protein